MARAIMIQGAGSNVGKSMIVAGLARLFARRGLQVRPFKPQNMSNNAAVTTDGGEIGRAQALQARAAGVPPSVHMNPVLLKPESETGAQVIVQGQRLSHTSAAGYGGLKSQLLPKVLESFAILKTEADLVIVEGAGSPAEVNLRAGDIANMGFALAADVPVVLVGDIDRGGVIAQMVGTHAVLDDADRAQIAAFAINKFRGDVSLFDDGLVEISSRTGWNSLGVIPWFPEAHRLPAEDVLDIASTIGGPCKVVVPKLPRIANFDDLDPLAAEPAVTLDIVEPGRALPGDADLLLLPGSKATIADLAAFRRESWDVDLAAHVRRGGHVLGVCGGYQMLGMTISDPDGIEGPPRTVEGLGLLEVHTTLATKKQLALRSGWAADTGTQISGYEIHLGRTTGADTARGWLTFDDQTEGAASADGHIRGCYLHGLFSSDDFRAETLARLGAKSSLADHDASVDAALEALADHLHDCLDIDALLSLAR